MQVLWPVCTAVCRAVIQMGHSRMEDVDAFGHLLPFAYIEIKKYA